MRLYSSQLAFGILSACVLFISCVFVAEAEESPAIEVEAEPEISSDLEPFLESYFETWSAGDMEGYRAHFHERATITAVCEGLVTLSVGREEFVEYQEQARHGKTLTERMTSFTAEEDEVAAAVTAEWALEGGTKPIVGIDRFTLIRDRTGNWKIVSLLFYTRRSDS